MGTGRHMICELDGCTIKKGDYYVTPIPKGYPLPYRKQGIYLDAVMHTRHLSTSDLLDSNIMKLKN